MQGRSRMAAFALVAGLVLGLSARGQADDKLVVKKMHLELGIAGLTSKGCKVDIKPGHAGCKFTPVLGKTVKDDGVLSIDLKDVEIRSPDRDCSFAITIKEEGQPEQTTHRGFRIANPVEGRPNAAPTFTC